MDLIVGGLGIAVLGAGIVGTIAWRRAYAREMPLSIWGREFASAEAAARALAETTRLDIARQSDGLGWVAALFLAPIWFIWGDLRTRRPERHLTRWDLSGKRNADRTATIALGADGSTIAVACAAHAGVAVDLARPLDDQEGLRMLHPVGGERWQRAVGHLDALKGLGVTRLCLENGMLEGELPLEPRGGVTGYATALDELEALAALLELA